MQKAIRHNSKRMQARRASILEQARVIILRGGTGALSVRALSEAAEVAVGTVYRLIGTKEEVLIALLAQANEQMQERIRARASWDSLDLIEGVTIEAVKLFAEDEDYYRSAYLAVDHLYEARSRLPTVARVFDEARQILVAGYQSCIDAGLLKGNISADVLANLVFQARLHIIREWAAGYLGLQALYDEMMKQSYIVLLSDGKKAFKAVVLRKLQEIGMRQVDAAAHLTALEGREWDVAADR